MRSRAMRLLTFLLAASSATAAAEEFRFVKQAGRLEILLGDKPFATYVFADKEIPRPYFAHVSEPGGIQVTRNHPPKPGDPQDHATFHPGIFLAFGDLKGSDSWRLKARVAHDGFLEEPASDAKGGRFAVRNRYLAADGKTTVCTETCRYTLVRRPSGVLLDWDSTFTSDAADFHFGDQEEMGLGVRVASPLREKGGNGRVVNNDGIAGAGNNWGKPAAWCDYSGTIDGRYVGVTMMASPENLRPSWWHNRDYGVFVANLFGRQAMRQGPVSRIDVKRGEPFRLRYGLVVHGTTDQKAYDPAAEYKAYLKWKEAAGSGGTP
jgi:hypothetical protein